MRSIPNIYFGLIVITALWAQCANIGNPEGGPRDLSPPEIDSTESTPNLQRNFDPASSKTDIVIRFNEWVKLEDAFKQVVVSPPLQYTPRIELKGKGIFVRFDPREQLKANTTYTINFGNAIKDITENNPVRDLRYVFSTGDIIDTAYIGGKLADAFSGETKENMIVMLYENQHDTVVFKERPTYFSRTDKNGHFLIRNIKDTVYKIFALEDANSNYLYDQDKEIIAFLDREVRSGEDSTTLLLQYYSSYVRPRITEQDAETGGLVKIMANFPYEEMELKTTEPSISLFPMKYKDTLMVYYLPDTSRGWSLEINLKGEPVDTVNVNRVRRMLTDTFKCNTSRQDFKSVASGVGFTLSFNHPLGQSDTNRIVLVNDTTQASEPYQLKSGTMPNELELFCNCTERQTYSLTILPGAIPDYKGRQTDTLRFKLRGLEAGQTGLLTIECLDLDSSQTYVIDLIQDDKAIRSSSHSSQSTYTLTYSFLTPGNFSLRITEDRNQNLRWDPGDYRQNILPEKVLTRKNISVRANWEVREQISWINQ